MKKIFQKIGGLIPRRNRFDLSYTKKMTCDMGKIYPVMCEEVVPGDTWKVGNNIVVRFQPLVAPILHNISVKVHYFFVPYRLLWSKLHNDEYLNAIDDDWETFITGQNMVAAPGDEDVKPEPVLPRYVPDVNWFGDEQLTAADVSGKGSLWDFFGMPTGEYTVDSDNVGNWQDSEVDNCPVIFPWSAYNLIYNEYYRDENLIERVPLDNPKVLNCCWSKDYFTAALPWQQRGVAPALPISGFGNAIFTGDFVSPDVGAGLQSDGSNVGGLNSVNVGVSSSVHRAFLARTGSAWPVPGEYISGSPFKLIAADSPLPDENYNPEYDIDSYNQAPLKSLSDGFNENMRNALNQNRVSMDNVNTFDIADLRLAFQVQKWLERNARGGTRYTEFLRAHFGVSPRDDRLQRPEYIGGSKSPVIISEVLQTSSTDSTSAQGNLAGHGIVADGNYCSSYTATEFGLIMGLMTIVPETEYQQGINRQWLRKTKYDYYSPEFAHLSEQAVEEGELYWTSDKSKDIQIFGYQGRYDEMRTKQNMTCSGMRDTFDYWHLGRKFDSAPNLNADFVTCNPSKRIFAVQDEDTLIVSFHNRIRAIRPLPLMSSPGLIDHS